MDFLIAVAALLFAGWLLINRPGVAATVIGVVAIILAVAVAVKKTVEAVRTARDI